MQVKKNVVTTSDEPKKYLEIVEHYEACLEKHGDTHLGVNWPNEADADLRYRVMLDLLRWRNTPPVRDFSLLDFGCGTSHLYDFINRERIDGIAYSGLDLSPKFIELSQKKYPQTEYFCLDILDPSAASKLPLFDYAVVNGVFTEKLDLSNEEMFAYLCAVITRLSELTKVGIAFNVMSSHVDWEREDLFHLPIDRLAAFLKANVSRHFVIRQDYGLYEYTCYVYKEANS